MRKGKIMSHKSLYKVSVITHSSSPQPLPHAPQPQTVSEILNHILDLKPDKRIGKLSSQLVSARGFHVHRQRLVSQKLRSGEAVSLNKD